MIARSPLRWALAVGMFLVFPALTPIGSLGQTAGGEKYSMMSPQALIQAWESAGRRERPLIEDALIGNRLASLLVLRDRLINGSYEEKRFAASLVAEMRDRASVDALLAASHDADNRVRTRAITALRLIGDPRALPRLRELAQTASEGPVLKVTVAALGRLGSSQDLGLLRPMLLHSDAHVRVIAAAALAMQGSSEGQAILLESTRSPDPLAQQEATFGLGYLATPEARARLSEILDSPAGRWKSYAAIGLALQDISAMGVNAKRVEYLSRLAKQRQDWIVAGWAVEQLADLGLPEARQVLQDLARSGGKAGERAGRTIRARGWE